MAMFINNCKKLPLISAQLLRSTSVASQILTSHKSHDSKKFPGYHVVYSMDSIQLVRIMNRLKRNATIFMGITAPLSYVLESMSYLQYEVMSGWIFSGSTIALFLHCCGYFCNNVVGFIYSDKKNEDLVISYVNYWGKRIDVKTSFSEIDCIETTNKYKTPTFNKIIIPSKKLSLKLAVKGNIIDEKAFYKLFGIGF